MVTYLLIYQVYVVLKREWYEISGFYALLSFLKQVKYKKTVDMATETSPTLTLMIPFL